MTQNYTPVACTIPIAYLGGFQIGDCYVTGQPADPQGFQAIATAGVKSVICLRDPTEPGFDLNEDSALLALHISYTNIPIPHGIDQSIQDGHLSGLANPAFVQLVQNYPAGSRPISLEI